ncbi:aldehyde dehydrogenase family protein [Novosphingobium album (ex Liu et al. 2023)]|uniref:Aldehyde dehydrogenase family protein n=1 Tax=Novosphingobium album (ex Liu et al. 2023) TaxID=3031130 RepID=A0ABT5WRU1_9SPHN|nr:aldehyde dehydrogenase family protein [Novosphingobium album (ex Liu et al. 2023)]MDE8652756.1 aldehyde dehydrogenase family protein [Novosphingobium album (ex Liu et al. 2023)]
MSIEDFVHSGTAQLIRNEPRIGEGAILQVVNPATEELIASFPGASISQVDEAVFAAKSAFENGQWGDPQFRRDVIHRFADEIERHADNLMETLVAELGTPANLKANHIGTAVSFLRWNADAASVDRTRNLGLNVTQTATTTIAYRPVGVVAAISAFNYPIFIAAAKIGAALAAGCTVVLLSSPLAPLAVGQLGELVRRADFPEGVVNILSGGADVGKALTEHPDIDKVTFTGSVEVGRMVMQQAATQLTGVVLELGGKSAAILLPGVDFAKYAFQLHARYARNAGQGCGSPTRILVEESRYDEFVQVSREAYAKLKVGDPRDPETILGPVVTDAQRRRIEDSVERALSEGGTIVAGGGRPDMPKGWYINPVLIGGLENKSHLAQNEIFGPVSVIITYRTVEEAIEIANDSELGLKAYIFGPTSDCLKIAPRLRVGTVQINGGSPNRPDAPIVGYKKSGVGAEWGEDGLREFLRPQNIDIPFIA